MNKYINSCVAIFIMLLPLVAFTSDKYITLQSTTSVRDSGLLNYIIPQFRDRFDVNIRVIANGTGQAIKNSIDCNGDLLLVHSLKDEINFVNQGYGISRYNLMYNDFVIIGPSSNPAKITSSDTIKNTLENIAVSGSKFISRSDDSGTHKREMSLWVNSKVKINDNDKWYVRAGQGMGATLNIAVGMNAYTLTDRSTWLKFRNKANHKILYESETHLKNEYGIIVVNPQHCPNAKVQSAQLFVDWLTSDNGKTAIESYRIDNNQVFFVE